MAAIQERLSKNSIAVWRFNTLHEELLEWRKRGFDGKQSDFFERLNDKVRHARRSLFHVCDTPPDDISSTGKARQCGVGRSGAGEMTITN